MREGRLYLVRHGRTAWNGLRYQGWEETPLDDVGISQAGRIALWLEKEKIDAIYSSPLSRAVETIRPLAEKRRLAIRTAEELKEIDYGRWQGSLKSEHRLKVKERHLYRPLPDGESLFDVYRRSGRFMKRIEPELAEGRHLVVVGHFWSNRMLLGLLCGIPFEGLIDSDYHPENGSLLNLRYLFKSGEGVRVPLFSFTTALQTAESS